MRTTERLLTTAEVAERLAVAPSTVSNWAKRGLLPAIRLPGGHRRFRETDVEALTKGGAA